MPRDNYATYIAEKVNYLFENCRKPDGTKYSFTEVEEGTGGQVHYSWISRLASGKVDRPGIQVLEAITDFFEVDGSFWFSSPEDGLKMKAKADTKPDDVRLIALRASELSADSRQIVLDLIESMKRNEKGQKKQRGDDGVKHKSK